MNARRTTQRVYARQASLVIWWTIPSRWLGASCVKYFFCARAVHWSGSHACRLIVYLIHYRINMSCRNLTSSLLFSHRGHPYAITLQEHPGKRWTWNYVLHDVQVTGEDEPVDDEVNAIALGMAAAAEHID